MSRSLVGLEKIEAPGSPPGRASPVTNVPGIWSRVQIDTWREITDAVHAKGSFIWCQLWVLGRASRLDPARRKELGVKHIGPSAVPVSPNHPIPEEMSEEDIQATIEDHRIAARNAIEAGFDGVQIRLSPWSDYLGMGMDDPIPDFTYLVQKLRALDLGFLDLVEARIRGNEDADCGGDNDVSFAVHV
ncbi:chanoclavine-I aldehyde reductase [Microdochium nivale]|nr:chanoclavine-I aldehyde reductase [Microdochium nivale]